MSSYVNPSFVNEQVTYTTQTTGVQPIAAPYKPAPCPAPVVPIAKHHKHGYCGYNSTGTILVLFILLVIISRAWLV